MGKCGGSSDGGGELIGPGRPGRLPEEVTFKPSIQELRGKLIPGGEEGIPGGFRQERVWCVQGIVGSSLARGRAAGGCWQDQWG